MVKFLKTPKQTEKKYLLPHSILLSKSGCVLLRIFVVLLAPIHLVGNSN
jgi:hypothetical protein